MYTGTNYKSNMALLNSTLSAFELFGASHDSVPKRIGCLKRCIGTPSGYLRELPTSRGCAQFPNSLGVTSP